MKPWFRAGRIAAALLWLFASSPVRAQTDSESSPGRVHSATRLRLFIAPDESSSYTELTTTNRRFSPVAEMSANGSKWFLLRTQDGFQGWVKRGDSDQADMSEKFFKSLPSEPMAVTLPPPDVPRNNSVAVPIRMIGAAAFVTAMLNHAFPASMLIDTGASHTVISHQLATKLRLPDSSQATMLTASGPIVVPLAVLPSMEVGDAEALNLTVGIHDISNNRGFDGLLGMDFLGRFNASIDSRRGLLILNPR